MWNVYKKREEKRNNGKNRTTKAGKLQDTLKKENYKYLETDTINQTEMKEKLIKGYLRRTKNF